MHIRNLICSLLLLVIGWENLEAQTGNPPNLSSLQTDVATDDWAQREGLSVDQLEALKGLILDKVNMLTNCIAVIADKSKPDALRNDAVEEAADLFMTPEKRVEVSSKNRSTTQSYKVGPYFRRLKILPYRKVVITFYEVATLSELEKHPDGYWVATATIFQLFEAFDGEGNLKYRDKTVKDVEVVVDEMVHQIGDQTHRIMDVKLGNISVQETI